MLRDAEVGSEESGEGDAEFVASGSYFSNEDRWILRRLFQEPFSVSGYDYGQPVIWLAHDRLHLQTPRLFTDRT